MTSPAVSYIIPVFNGASTLEQSVLSILDGNFGPSDELVIIDDASTDDTPRVIDGLCRRDRRIRSFRHRFNKGSAAAGRNTGIEQAAHELIFCLDADNVLVPGSVPKLAAHMVENGAGAAAFQELRYFRHGDAPARVTHKWVFRPGAVSLADALAGPYWPGPSGNYLFTRASWVAAGRYDEGVGAGVDSWAFGMRQLASGTKMVVMPDSGYFHRYGHASAFVREHAASNLSLVGLRTLLTLLPRMELRDADYVMSRRGREHWFDELESRPLRLRGEPPGHTGRVEYLAIAPPARRQPRLLDRVSWKLRQLMGRGM